jgi:hypothetical protein
MSLLWAMALIGGVTVEMRERAVIGGCGDPDESPEFHKMIFEQEKSFHLYRLEK